MFFQRLFRINMNNILQLIDSVKIRAKNFGSLKALKNPKILAQMEATSHAFLFGNSGQRDKASENPI